MPYNAKNRLQTPDFLPDQPQMGWQQMGDDQPINIQPAVGAFQQRFMQKPNMGTGSTPMPTSGDLPMDMGGMDAGGGAAMKKGGIKSL